MVRIVRIALGVCAVTCTWMILATAPDAFATSVGPYCELYALTPTYSGSEHYMEYNAYIDCNTNYNLGLQVYTQVENGSSWYTVSGTETPSSGYEVTNSPSDYFEWGGVYSATDGHTYRSTGKGAVGSINGSGGFVIAYGPDFDNSSGFTCGCG